MALFEPIVQWLLYQEDDKRHPGKIVNLGDGAGSTRLGITSKNYGDILPAEFWTDMPFSQAVPMAKKTYKSYFWNRFLGDQIESDVIAAMILSFNVNTPPGVAVKHLQIVLGLDDDGVLGPKTVAELNSKDDRIVASMYRAEWIGYYRHVVDVNPAKSRFLDGWINRANFPYPSSQVPDIYV